MAAPVVPVIRRDERARLDQSPVDVDFRRKVVCVLGLPFDVLSLEEAAQRIFDAAHRRKPCLMSTANLNFVITARTDEEFRDSVLHSHLSLADGMPIVWVSRLLGLPIKERVPGSSLFEALQASSSRPAVKVYFFGAPDGVAESASEQVNSRDGGVRCVGFEAPAYVPVEAMSGGTHTQRINDADPDFVVVSLGAQKGQAWIEMNRDEINAPILSHLGAVVSFAAGAVKRAPSKLQGLGLEWLWRIKEEPRLWRRYAGDGFQFAQLLVTRVLPLWWQQTWAGGLGAEDALSIETERHGAVFQVRPRGVCSTRHLPALQTAFAEAATAQRAVLLDMTDVRRIDAAAMGTLLLLFGHQRDIRQPLKLVGVSPELRRQFRYHCTDYLLGQPEPRLGWPWLAEADPR